MIGRSRIIQTPWLNYLCRFVNETKDELFVVSPFFSLDIVERVIKYAGKDVQLNFLLGANPRAIAAGTSDYDALVFLNEVSSQRFLVIKNIVNLHGKVIISDRSRAIVSSSNLTRHGLERNIEFGVELDQESSEELYKIVKQYWDVAQPLAVGTGVNSQREKLKRFQENEKNKETPEMPFTLGSYVDPQGTDSGPVYPTISTKKPLQSFPRLKSRNENSNLLFNIWWNDNQFRGACLDISDKTVCRDSFIKRYGEDRTQDCEKFLDGCDTAYIFSNYAMYVGIALNDSSRNKCAFFITRNPKNNKYWLIGYLLVGKIGENFTYTNQAGHEVSFRYYIKGDRSRSLRFQPYLVFDEELIRQLSLGDKWGPRDTSEVNWITHHTRSRICCTYLSNADASAILETYCNSTKNTQHKAIVSTVLEQFYYR